MAPAMSAAIIYGEQLPYAKPPFTYEYIEERKDPDARWRIRDAKDDAVGHAGSVITAINAAHLLNGEFSR